MTEKYYITTAINYTNGPPHIGHCYEAIISDFLARYHRLLGQEVFFLTGTDEHGLKISKSAEEKGVSPIEIADFYSNKFQGLAQKLQVSHDFFIRTTMPTHEKTVHELFERIRAQDDIYLGEYEGWYNVREETYLSETDAKKCNYLDGLSGKPLTKVKEPSYFFRLSKYGPTILKHIEENPGFIFPPSQREHILRRLRTDELRDLSISRTSFTWGIPVPNDPDHYIYVWFEALINYYTGTRTSEHLKGFWPANIHVIGKDITWFHSVIWPAMLLSAGLELPNQIMVHNFICDENGQKMSKSLGNVVDVEKLLEDYPVEIIRTYLLSEYHPDHDLNFSYRKLKLVNNEQADKIGNLVNRVTSLAKKYCQGQVPTVVGEPLFDLEELKKDVANYLQDYRFHELVALLQRKITSVNEYLVKHEPWNILTPADPIGGQTEEDRSRILRTCLEAIRIIAYFWSPIQPAISQKILHRLNDHTAELTINELDWFQLSGPVTKGSILFKKMEVEPENK